MKLHWLNPRKFFIILFLEKTTWVFTTINTGWYTDWAHVLEPIKYDIKHKQ